MAYLLLRETESNDKILTLDFNQKNTCTQQGLLFLGNSRPTERPALERPLQPWITANVRRAWDVVPQKSLRGNFFMTLNPDPNCDWYTTNNDKKTIVTKFLTAIEKLKASRILLSSVFVYEYGDKGKKDGKIHFHGIIKTEDKDAITNAILKEFNQRSNAKHRTLNLKVIKKVSDRENMINYMKKECQNKKKCLYFN